MPTEDDLLYNRRVKVIRWLDGDTFDSELDQGFGQFIRPAGRFKMGQFRLYGIDAPETSFRRPGLTEEQWAAEKEAGLKAKARCEELMPPGKVLYVQSRKPDKYGRWLALVWFNVADIGRIEKSVNYQLLVIEKIVRPYEDEPLNLA